jgi:serine/threonine protein kinase
MLAHPTSHPTDQTLTSYGLGKLDDGTAEAVNQHLEQCPDCRKRVAEMSADSFLERMRDAQKSEDHPAFSQSQASGRQTRKGTGAPAPPPANTLRPGLADSADYEITRELGRGGMGVVYLAQNKLMGRKEVLKVVGGHLIDREGVPDRFLREIRSAARLRHANIVTAYAAHRIGEGLVLAMEYVEGLDLARMVKASGPLPVDRACNYVYQAALGLQHAHEHGMVHRDIKPANLILSQEGKKAVIKVLDFGLAKVTSEGQSDSSLTREGQMLGTPDFIAPEQIRDAQLADIRADIYSLGCTFYYLLVGRPPFEGDSLWDLYQAHFSMEAGPLNLVRPDVPVELAALVAKMMAKDPARRFQTPGEVAEALAPYFKKGNVQSVGSKPDTSQVGLPAAKRAAPGAIPIAGPPPTAMASEPAPAARKASEPARPRSILEGLIDLRDEDPLFDTMLDRMPPAAVPKFTKRGILAWTTSVKTLSGLGPRGRWAAAGGLFIALVLASVMIVRTRNGTIVFENLPEQSVVTVDGDKFDVEWPDGKGKGHAQVTIPPGKHRVEVKVNGIRVAGDEVIVEWGAVRPFRVHTEPPPGPAQPPAVKSISRTTTDDMLIIKTNLQNVINNSVHFRAAIDRKAIADLRGDKVYIKEIFGRKDVLCTEALSPSAPATVDFSKITGGSSGRLILWVHGLFGHGNGQRVVVRSDGVIVKAVTVYYDYLKGWQEIAVPFRRSKIVMEHHPDGWAGEFLFIDYQVVEEPAPETSAGGKGDMHTSANRRPDRSPAVNPRAPHDSPAAPNALTVTLRQGGDGYNGVLGLNYFGSGKPDPNGNPCLWVDWPDAGQQGNVALLRFDDLFAHTRPGGSHPEARSLRRSCAS